MSMPWKVLVGALVTYVVALTYAFCHMVEYLQYLHFSGTVVPSEGLSSTTPGMEVSVLLGVVGTGAVLVSIGAFVADVRRRDAAP